MFLGIFISIVIVAIAIVLIMRPWSGDELDDIVKSYADISAIQSGRMVVFTTLTDETKEQLIEMEWVYPDCYQGKISEESDIIEFIIIRDNLYVKSDYPEDVLNNWSYMIGRQFLYYLYNTGAQELLDSLTDLKQLPDEVIDSTDCLHYLARVDMDREVDRIEELFESYYPPDLYTPEEIQQIQQDLEQLRDIEIKVEFWIGKEDNIFRQLETDCPYTAALAFQLEDISFLVKYYEINQTIVIEPPETSSGKLLPGWMLATY